MHILTLDIGNTNVKTDLWEDNELVYHHVSREVPYDEISCLTRRYDTIGSIVSSVRGDMEKVAVAIKDITDKAPCLFNIEKLSDKGRHIRYEGNIGADRVAAFLGAEMLSPGKAKLIVDAGTAMTEDVVDKAGMFCGGMISPGLQGRLKSLCVSTSLLPLIEVAGDKTPDFGYNTETAISSGIIYGMAGEILYSYKRAGKLYDTGMIVLTGGDAPLFKPLIEKEGIKVKFDPYLVSRGLYGYFRDYCLNRVEGLLPKGR